MVTLKQSYFQINLINKDNSFYIQTQKCLGLQKAYINGKTLKLNYSDSI